MIVGYISWHFSYLLTYLLWFRKICHSHFITSLFLWLVQLQSHLRTHVVLLFVLKNIQLRLIVFVGISGVWQHTQLLSAWRCHCCCCGRWQITSVPEDPSAVRRVHYSSTGSTNGKVITDRRTFVSSLKFRLQIADEWGQTLVWQMLRLLQ